MSWQQADFKKANQKEKQPKHNSTPQRTYNIHIFAIV